MEIVKNTTPRNVAGQSVGEPTRSSGDYWLLRMWEAHPCDGRTVVSALGEFLNL